MVKINFCIHINLILLFIINNLNLCFFFNNKYFYSHIYNIKVINLYVPHKLLFNKFHHHQFWCIYWYVHRKGLYYSKCKNSFFIIFFLHNLWIDNYFSLCSLIQMKKIMVKIQVISCTIFDFQKRLVVI